MYYRTVLLNPLYELSFDLKMCDIFMQNGLVLVNVHLCREQRSFYGVNLAALHSPVVDEYLKQPIVVGC